MDPYRIAVFLHVLAATVLVGASLVFPLTRATIRRVGSVEELRTWLDFARRCSAANPLCAMILLATGVFLGWRGGWWSEGWFQVALALFVVNSFCAVRALGAAGAELGAAAGAAPAGRVPDRLRELTWSPRLDVAADLLLANDLAALFVMILKPGLAGSCASVAAANGVLFALRRRRRSARATVGGARAPAAAA